MADLTGKKIANTYKDLLQINSSASNSGIDETLRNVQDGSGNSSSLKLSQTEAAFSGNVSVNGNMTVIGTFQPDTINSSEIVTSTLNATRINATSITTDELNATTLIFQDVSVSSLRTGDLFATTVSAGTVSATTVAATNITLAGEPVATSAGLATVSSTMATSIANVSAALETRIAGVSSTFASTSATLESHINTVSATLSTTNVALQTSIANVSSTMATSIANVSAALETRIAAVSSTMATSIANVSAALETRIAGVSSTFAGTSATLESRIATVSNTLATSIANVSAALETRIAGVSSTFATTSATLESRIATLSSTMATSIATVSAALQTKITTNINAITSINNVVSALSSVVNDVNASAIAANAQAIALANTSIAANASSVAINMSAITSVNTIAVAAMPKAGGTFTGQVTFNNNGFTINSNASAVFNGRASFRGASGQSAIELGNSSTQYIDGVARWRTGLVPTSTATHNFGNDSLRWNRAYITEFIGGINAALTSVSDILAGDNSSSPVNSSWVQDRLATKASVGTSATLETRIAGVSSTFAATSATLETRIAGVSSTFAATSATLETRIATLSSTMATSIGNQMPKTGGTFTGGITVTGNVTATSFYGDGSNLTGITSDTGGTVTELKAGSNIVITEGGVTVTETTTSATFAIASSPSFDGLTVDTNTLYVDSANNRVGIGTTSPSYHVDLNAGTDNFVLNAESTDAGAYIRIKDNNATGYYIGANSGNFDVYNTSNQLRMRIDSSGVLTVGGNTVWHAGNDGSGSGLDADTLDGIDSVRFPYALNGSLGTTNTFTGDGGIGANNIARSMFFRDNNGQFGTIGIHVSHATSSNYAWQIASTSYSNASSIQARVKNNGTWTSPVTIWNSGNDGSGSGLDADTLDGIDSSQFLRSDADDSTTGGLRVISGSIASTDTSKGLLFDAQYTNGQYRTRFRKQDKGGGVPLYIDASSGTANSYTELARFGAYSGNGYELEVFGDINATGNLYDGGNAVWHAGNDGSGSGLDADTLDGVQGSSFFRNNYQSGGDLNTDTAAGIYRFNTGVSNVPNNMTYGTMVNFNNASDTGFQIVADYHTAELYWRGGNSSTFGGGGTNTSWFEIWNSGNDGSGSGLDADTVDGLQGTDLVETSDGTGVNLDTAYDAQMFGFSPTTGGTKPGGSGYGQGISIVSSGKTHNNSNNWISQLAFSTSQDDMYFRGKTNAGSWGSWHEVWHTGNDGSGSGLDADTVDGVHESTFMRRSANSNLDMNNYVIQDFDRLEAQAENKDVKLGVWSDNTYGIGMVSGVTYGSLNDYAMTFCMNNDSDRGFWWGYNGQSKSSGSMSLSIGGVLTVASSINVAGNTVWHNGNDGSGSGLDADTLDGVQGSSYLRSDASDTFAGTLTLDGRLIIQNDGVSGQGDNNTHFNYQGTGVNYIRGTTTNLNGTTVNCNARIEMSNVLDMNNYDIYGVDQILHNGDTNTYIQFHAEDQFRVVTGGTERLEVNSNGVHGNGVANKWVRFEQIGTHSTSGSKGVSSLTDNGTGKTRVNYSGYFSSTSYCCPAAAADASSGVARRAMPADGGLIYTTYIQITVDNNGSTNNDAEYVHASFFHATGTG